MTIKKIEDMFMGFTQMLRYLCEDLHHKNRLNDAKGIYLRNNLQGRINKEIEQSILDFPYDAEKD
jgi:hypothetical protein